MNIEEFILKFEELLELDAGNIQPSDKFREYAEWDSLALLSLMAMLEDEYGKTISRENFQKLLTVQDLFEFIKDN